MDLKRVNATEMRRKAACSSSVNASKELTAILKEIDGKAERGEHLYQFDGRLTLEDSNALKRRGFRLNKQSGTSPFPKETVGAIDYWVDISW